MATGSWLRLDLAARRVQAAGRAPAACTMRLVLAALLLVFGVAPAQEVTTTYVYDKLGRLVTAESGAPGDTTRVRYDYDRAGNLLGRSVTRPVFADGFEATAGVKREADVRP